jgi:uncharacterized membrane protein
MTMTLLVAGLVLFFVPHLLPMVPSRRAAWLADWGEARYKVLFSVASGLGLLMIVLGYAYGDRGAQLFAPSLAARTAAPYAMIVVFVLLAAANSPSNIRATLRHPMLIALLIWSIVHLLANGDRRGTVLFGSFAVYAIVDLASAIQRGAVKSFTPRLRADAICIVAGSALALLVMMFHRILFGPVVVPFGV